ncbi:hypothetical protein FRZ44_27960 [Hypericibacter terrae]|uniref:Lipoprotein n=1 Tax=Hypericibacter terrae TaxID=2602015 RepID=A0A5J6MRK1_9PROT|nr:hypothetical protein [Hypericibacter terrae]QEX17496.1 hypothetical protein FRZ44_27960 [Hypericibacter terrae]
MSFTRVSGLSGSFTRAGFLPVIGLLGLLFGASAQAQDAVRCTDIPNPVAKTRDAIIAATKEKDFGAFSPLIDRNAFAASVGDDIEPISYWESLKKQGDDVRPIMAALLKMPCSVYQGAEGEVFTWPTAADIPYEKLTKKEIADLQKLYGGRLEDQYIEGHEVGYYAGWRLSINSDGTWSEFVAGD